MAIYLDCAVITRIAKYSVNRRVWAVEKVDRNAVYRTLLTGDCASFELQSNLFVYLAIPSGAHKNSSLAPMSIIQRNFHVRQSEIYWTLHLLSYI